MSKKIVKQSTKVAIRKTNLNFTKMISMNLLRKNWGKEYTIYTYDDVTITCQMKSFDFPKDCATFEVIAKCPLTDNSMGFTMVETVEYHRKNMSLAFFQRYFNRSLIGNLERKIDREIEWAGERKYSELKHWRYSLKDEEVKSNFPNEWKEIAGLSEKLYENAFEFLQDKTADLLNIDYDNKVKQYVRYNKLKNKNIYKLLAEIRKITPKAEDDKQE